MSREKVIEHGSCTTQQNNNACEEVQTIKVEVPLQFCGTAGFV
jgi:hypothetical protein